MREQFEKLPEIAEIIKEGVFWDGEIYRRTAICKLTHLYYVRGAWYAWQAKAQAVPEGFILVPKEPTQAMLDSARDWSTKKYGKAVGNDGASGCYKAMIEAVEKNQ